MTDPYGRSKLPTTPGKPKLFNPLTPFKLGLFAWFMLMDLVFRFSWKKLVEDPHGWSSPEAVAIFIILGNFLLSLPTALVSYFVFGLGPGWIFCIVVGMYLLNLFFYFTFQLHDKDSREYWMERLRT